MSDWHNDERNIAEEREADDYVVKMGICDQCGHYGQVDLEIFIDEDEYFCSEECKQLYRRN